jgi:alpha-mannosidase
MYISVCLHAFTAYKYVKHGGKFMSLTIEWQRRVDNWLRELPNHFYRPLGPVAVSGFTTAEHLRPEAALQGDFQPMPAGTPWGAPWEYGWFQGRFTLPPAIAGERAVVRMNLGGEGLVWLNGHLAGAADREHTEITLEMQAQPGASYDVLAEIYAGHGGTPVGGGPVGYGTESVPVAHAPMTTIGESTFGIWNEEVYQLWFDAQTLYQLRNSMDPESLRVAEIDTALRDFTLICDLELPYAEMLETVRAARARLAPALACHNGSTAPTLYAFGHAHLDVAWLWPLAETERKIARTLSNQLTLIKEYPGYKYQQSQTHLFYMLKTLYPEVYAEVKEAITAGTVVPEGGMWVEADTNIAGGEALIRQFVHGKRWFSDEFGIKSELLWLPDVFGYSGNMPQIMAGCGIKYFATQKIFWTYNGGDRFPYNTFTWEGIDGSTVLAHIFNDYNSRTGPADLAKRWTERVQKDDIHSLILSFGHGDGGGGPTREHLEYLRRSADLEGLPRVRMSSPNDFFHEIEATGVPSERYVGELYFQAHRGTYTSQAKTKRNNRKIELALREAEMWSTASHTLAGDAYPQEMLDQTWRTLLLHQFHDILPGSSIERVYAEAEQVVGAAIVDAENVAQAATATLTHPAAKPALTVFNSLSWPRTAFVPLPAGFGAPVDAQGHPLPTQTTHGGTLVEVTVPSCGWTTVYGGSVAAAPVAPALTATPSALENDLLRLTLNDRGEITSIFDKETGGEWATGPCNSFKMYKDVPNWFDAWDIDSMYELTPVALDAPAVVEVLSAGPLEASLRVTRTLHQSAMTQVISLHRGSRRVDFATEIDWQESHKLLKVAFPVAIHAEEAVHEIQFGHIRRPNHRSRPFDANRFEVCNHKWSALTEENRGFAVLNDCKYGLNVLANSINLTLLKSALSPDMTADKGHQTFTYAFYAWNGSLADSGVVAEAYDLNVPVLTAAGVGGEQSLFSVDAPNVVIETVKPAEDGSHDVVVRLYEAKRMATRATLTTSLPVKRAAQTDMLEDGAAPLPFADGKITLTFRPFEVKTVRLSL